MNNEPKISPVEIYFLMALAIVVDLINWIPLVNVPVSFVALIAFPWYFKKKGVPAYPAIISGLVGFIPVLSVLPETIAGVIACIILDRALASQLGSEALKGKMPAIRAVTQNPGEKSTV